jgi:hypothetical protein
MFFYNLLQIIDASSNDWGTNTHKRQLYWFYQVAQKTGDKMCRHHSPWLPLEYRVVQNTGGNMSEDSTHTMATIA